MMSRFIIKHLAFTGTGVPEARLDFAAGLNIIYGASDTGKTFTTKALTYMLGGSGSLPETEQIKAYSTAWLGLVMPNGREVTLHRTTRGGHFKLYQGLVSSEGSDYEILHYGVDSKRTDTISHFLLDAIGWSGKQIVSNADAKKDALTIAKVLPYMIVAEGDILNEDNPVNHSRQYNQQTYEANVLRFILTGQDDSGAVPTVSKTTHKVIARAKLELVDELIAQIDEELGEAPPDRGQLLEQIDRLENTLSGLHDTMREAQGKIDDLVEHRRFLMDRRDEDYSRASELDVTLERFGMLDRTYSTDLDRLQSLEESGYLLLARADRACPVCGAAPDAQRHRHAPEEFGLAHRAAAAEMRKIELEQRELRRTMSSVRAEASGLWNGVSALNEQIEETERQIEDARPAESSLRADYADMLRLLADRNSILELYKRRDRLTVRRSQIDSEKPEKRTEKLVVGIDGPTAYSLGEIVSEVLQAWKFPGGKDAQFDVETGDVTIAGKSRQNHGKGVRAVLHAAFNIALMLYCKGRELPHPGFVVLDTPLLTYREPLESKHGDLDEDEERIKNSPLALNFYDYLAELEGTAQVIVLENADPPSEIDKRTNIITFTKKHGEGRFGLFPA